MRVLHVVPKLSVERGGPTAVVVNLAAALARQGVESPVLTVEPRDPSALPRTPPPIEWLPAGLLDGVWTAHSPAMRRRLRQEVPRTDLVHVHELWHYPHYIAVREAARCGRPYLVSVHGQLAPVALRQKRWRKHFFLGVFQRRALANAGRLQALNDDEAEQIGRVCPGARIAVIPNGVSREDFERLPDPDLFDAGHPQAAGRFMVLFVGRLHARKGIGRLITAFARLKRQRPDACLVVVGPDVAGLLPGFRSMAERLGVADSVLFTGRLAGADKLAALARADVFALPSESEGFSIATLEAMAAEVPVVITPECRLPEVAEAGAGVVAAGPEELASALVRLAADGELRRRMGRRGRRLVLERYTWDRIARRFAEEYQVLIAGGTAGAGSSEREETGASLTEHE